MNSVSQGLKLSFLFLLIVFSSLLAHGVSTKASLPGKIEKLVEEVMPSDTYLGIYVVDAQSGEEVYARDADRLLTVASNAKLMVTACALVRLGPNFAFETHIYYRGRLSSDGMLSGDILVKGSGDPTISGRFLEGDPCAVFKNWAFKLKEKGVREVRGDLVLDDTCFDREFSHPSWPANQHTYWYSAEVAGLSFNDNCVDITASPADQPGKPVRLSVSPETNYVTILNQCVTTEREDEHLIAYYRRPGTNIIQVKGKYWVKAKPRTDSITIHNPPMYFGTVLKEVLEKEGIRIQGTLRLLTGPFNEYKDNLVLVGKYTSSLDQTLKVANKRSQNFYAEQLLKTLGRHIIRDGSFAGGARVVSEFLTEAGLEGEFTIVDGSGLSRANQFTPRQVVQLLRYIHGHEHGKIFVESLAVSGTDGTLAERMKDTLTIGKIKAKTGTLAGVQTLSGYIFRDDGRMLIFSMLYNDPKLRSSWKVRNAFDRICEVLLTAQIE